MKTTMRGKYQRGEATCLVKRSVQVPVFMRDGLREISKLETPVEHRGKGHATELLKAICEEADTQSLVLLLHVAPFGEAELGASQLERWYERFGFQTIQEEPKLMARMVGGTPRVLERSAVNRAIGAH
jgi:GNAT superfamily N-acetyltransferase